MSNPTELASLYARDLLRLRNEVAAFPSDESLWLTPTGIPNSAGNLTLHLIGNLSEFIGRLLAGQPYTRNRPAEFSSTGFTRADLTTQIDAVAAILAGYLPTADLTAQYPEPVFGQPMTNGYFLTHLYAHLAWHTGQINYLRRLVTKPLDEPTVQMVG